MRVLVVEPPQPVVSLDRAKEHLRVRHDDEGALIAAYVAAASGSIDGPDGWLGRALGVQTLEIWLPTFGTCGWISLPYPPAIEVQAVEYFDEAGDLVTLDAEAYTLRCDMLRPAWPQSFPAAAWRGATGDALRIEWTAGYEVMPAPIEAAILLMVGDLYAHRETAVSGMAAAAIPMSTTVENLLAPFRVYA